MLSPTEDALYSATLPTAEVVATRIWRVEATVYWAVESQCDDSPQITASGRYISDIHNPPRYLAISRDLEEYFSFGDTVVVSGTGELDGKWIVEDRMARRWRKKIDFLTPKGYMNRWDNVRMRIIRE